MDLQIRPGGGINLSALHQCKKLEVRKNRPFQCPVVFLISPVALLIGMVVGVRHYLHAHCHDITDNAFIEGDTAAEAGRAVSDARRYTRLYEQGMISRQQWDQAAAATQTANARLSAARGQVEVARAGAATTVAEVIEATTQAQRAEAQVGQAGGRLTETAAWHQQVNVGLEQATLASESVEQARANVRLAELQLSYTKIYAHLSGRITRRAVEVGDHVQVGQALMAIVSDNLYVIANFKETQIGLMAPGQSVDIRIDAFPRRIFRGHIDSIEGGSGAAFSLLPPENATGNYVKVVQRVRVKIVFDEALDGYLLGPGMSVVPEVQIR